VIRSFDWNPPRWHYARWPVTGKVARFLYVSGITRSGGSITHSGRVGTYYTLPRWRDILPKRRPPLMGKPGGWYRRPYILWLPGWWWDCHKRQGWKLWTHHRPYPPAALGICGRCLPCPKCGSPEMWCGCYG
jgi:hypothetical protein